MFRRVLTYQLILALAAGPLLCCCTTGRLLASGTPSTHPAGSLPNSQPPASAPQAPQITRSCCSHKHSPANSAKSSVDHSQTNNPRPLPHKPAQPGDQCPCKGSPDTTKTAPTKAESPDVSQVLRILTLDLPLLTTGQLTQQCQSGLEGDRLRGRNASRTSTADLLFAHHNLRC
jgi:hypothetical protein